MTELSIEASILLGLLDFVMLMRTKPRTFEYLLEKLRAVHAEMKTIDHATPDLDYPKWTSRYTAPQEEAT